MKANKQTYGTAAIVCVVLTAAFWYLRPLTPEQERLRDLTAAREKLELQIARGVEYLRGDEQAVHDARLASFRAQHRGAEAAAAGKELRARAERRRESNITRLDKLRARLAEVEMELREVGE